jgi:hypothetical protein
MLVVILQCGDAYLSYLGHFVRQSYVTNLKLCDG